MLVDAEANQPYPGPLFTGLSTCTNGALKSSFLLPNTMLPVSYFVPVYQRSRSGAQSQKSKRKRDDIEEDIEENVISDAPSRGKHLPLDGQISEPGPSSLADALEFETTPGADDVFSDLPTRPKRSLSGNGMNDALGKLKPPLLGRTQYHPPKLLAGQGTKTGGTRQRHLAILTAMMHRSFLQHDFVRAGRALGLLLRSEVSGHSVDLRNGHLWGLGAEILCRQQQQPSQASAFNTSIVELGLGAAKVLDQHVTYHGFEKARQYYDRLSLQYPYFKSFPDAIGPQDFRFAIFSLWIYISVNREGLKENVPQALPNHTSKSQAGRKVVGNSQGEAVHQAREISQQLDELMSSPPYSDNEMFRNLKVMVDRWTTDLGIGDGTNAGS